MNIKQLYRELQASTKGVDFLELRAMCRFHEYIGVRQGIVEAPSLLEDFGVMITVYCDGGAGYFATADISKSGLQKAFEQARMRAQLCAKTSITRYLAEHCSNSQGSYQSPVERDWNAQDIKERLELLQDINQLLFEGDSRIVDYKASLTLRRHEVSIFNSNGTEIFQNISMIHPHMTVTAHDKGVTEVRSFGGEGLARQGGLEVIENIKFPQSAQRIRAEALALVYAPQCPSGVTSLLLAPDQMILQIHESIGHPLEIDRILGDERNYAGTSFVKPEMFGTYQYGSHLLNVTFDPHQLGELASYTFDDEGARAHKVHLIKEGLLIAGLGAQLSQIRSGLPGVANARAVSWNRPAIDRMANINIEPGSSSLQDMIASIESGIYMETNCSWSIDDSRNKFQFGCELGRVIKNGTLGEVVRRPNYRGVSADFWRNLVAVGDSSTVEVLGTPYCGKGEPNQAITVGHASPACLFDQVDVFGGQA